MRANSDKLHTFPLGMNVLFAVTLHDNIGRAFAVASIPLKYRLNRQVPIILFFCLVFTELLLLFDCENLHYNSINMDTVTVYLNCFTSFNDTHEKNIQF